MIMGEAKKLDNKRSSWAGRVADAWNRGRAAIVETGRILMEAKASLPHGEFEAMVETDLPFGTRTAQCLMAIGRDQRITNAKHVALLPPSWGTLYELTRLNDETFKQAVDAGEITADMERGDVARLRRRAAADRAASAPGAADAQACAVEDLYGLARVQKPIPIHRPPPFGFCLTQVKVTVL